MTEAASERGLPRVGLGRGWWWRGVISDPPALLGCQSGTGGSCSRTLAAAAAAAFEMGAK